METIPGHLTHIGIPVIMSTSSDLDKRWKIRPDDALLELQLLWRLRQKDYKSNSYFGYGGSSRSPGQLNEAMS